MVFTDASEQELLMQGLIKKLISINQRGKPLILVSIIFYIIYIEIVLSVITNYYRFISLLLFLLLFLFWVYRLTVYDLRREKLPKLSWMQKFYFVIFTFISLFVMTLRFSSGESAGVIPIDPDFTFILYIILSFSFFLWIIFVLISLIAIPGLEIRFYFRIIFLSALVNTGINFLLKQ